MFRRSYYNVLLTLPASCSLTNGFLPTLVLKAPIRFSSLKQKQALKNCLQRSTLSCQRKVLVIHSLGEPVASFAVISHCPSKLYSLAVANACPLVGMVKKNLPFEICHLKYV